MFGFLFNGHLDDDEDIYFIAHRHPFTALRDVGKYMFFGFAMPLLFVFLFPPFWLFAGIWMFLGFFRIIYAMMDWYFDAWLLTNKSVIDLEWNGLFNRSSTRVEYHMIEGVAYEFSGVAQTVFRYGDISIEKIGSGAAVILKDAMNPRGIESAVLKYQNKFVSDKNYREHDALKGLLTDMLHEQAKRARQD